MTATLRHQTTLLRSILRRIGRIESWLAGEKVTLFAWHGVPTERVGAHVRIFIRGEKIRRLLVAFKADVKVELSSSVKLWNPSVFCKTLKLIIVIALSTPRIGCYYRFARIPPLPLTCH